MHAPLLNLPRAACRPLLAVFLGTAVVAVGAATASADDDEYKRRSCTYEYCEESDCDKADQTLGGAGKSSDCKEDSKTCEYRKRRDGAACDDGDPCTLNDACRDGVCVGKPRDCSAKDGACTVGVCNATSGTCEARPVFDGKPCDDGLFCTVGETCNGGACHAGNPRDCSAQSDQCNEGYCDEHTKACEARPAFDGHPCDDGLFCSVGETCNGGVCHAGNPRDCSAQSDQCNLGVCNDITDQCEAEPANQGLPCDDREPCTVRETCDSAGQCANGQAYDCSGDEKNTACARATCDSRFAEANCEGPLEPINEGGICTDGTSCTPVDTCRNGQCIGVGCGDPDRDGVRTLRDCLDMVIGALRPERNADGVTNCPLDSCDLNGNCKVDVGDALGCLHCAVALDSCAWFDKCPIPVGFVMYSSANADSGWKPDSVTEYSDYLAGVDYAKAPGEFCGSGPGNISPYPVPKAVGGNGELICETLVNQANPACAGVGIFPDNGETVLPTTSAAFAGDPGCEDNSFSGATLARCFFVQEPLARMDICDPAFDIPAAFQTLDSQGKGEGALPAFETVCTVAGPRCGNRVCEIGEATAPPGTPPVTPHPCPVDCTDGCGDGQCQLPSETEVSCPNDCATGSDPIPPWPSSTPACVP